MFVLCSFQAENRACVPLNESSQAGSVNSFDNFVTDAGFSLSGHSGPGRNPELHEACNPSTREKGNCRGGWFWSFAYLVARLQYLACSLQAESSCLAFYEQVSCLLL